MKHPMNCGPRCTVYAPSLFDWIPRLPLLFYLPKAWSTPGTYPFDTSSYQLGSYEHDEKDGGDQNAGMSIKHLNCSFPLDAAPHITSHPPANAFA